ncbi:MAG: Uma2 family endonuclease [Thermomicrobiales bacterium]|jgi:Uma2 family endonuclease|nr:Uma2 family endonuclease [Thermomicrobiales bacterium]
MGRLAIHPASQAERPFTFKDWLGLPEDFFRYEILAGELIVSRTPSLLHQHAVGNLLYALHSHLKAIDSGVVYSYLGVKLGEYDVVIPDLVAVLHQHSFRIQEVGIIGPPDLIAEVVAPETSWNDRVRKAATYARFGVAEYWLVDPDRQTIEAQTLVGQRYEPIAAVDGLIRSRAISGLVINPAEVFAGTDWMPVDP